MKKYEMLCVLPGTLAEGEVAPIVAQIEEQLKAHGGEEIVATNLGKSRLAYPIKHIRYGYFEFFTYTLPAEKAQALERGVRLLGNTLRVAIQVYNPKQTGVVTLAEDPTALSAPQKGEDSGRPARYDRGAEKKEEKVLVPEEKKPVTDEPKLNLENIDEKLDAMLQKDIDKV